MPTSAHERDEQKALGQDRCRRVHTHADVDLCAHNPKVAGSNPAPATTTPWSDVMSGQGLFASRGATVPLPASRRRCPCWCDESGEHVGGVALHAGQHVLVDGHRERRRRMPEAFADDFQRDAVLQHQPGVGVAQVVQPDRGDPRHALQSFERLRQGSAVGCRAGSPRAGHGETRRTTRADAANGSRTRASPRPPRTRA